MSNTQVGNVYQQIIADVVESSRVDFEEGGVEEQVLEELRRGWQQKLSQLKVATFPWDPKPEPVQPIANPPTVPSNAGQSYMSAPPPQQPMYAPQMPQMPMPQINNGPRIKSEPGLDSPTGGQSQQLPYQAPILPPQATIAQQRAAMSLQANYGQRAAASINAIQGNMSQQQQQQNAPSMQQMQQAQYQQQMAMQNQRVAGVPQQQRSQQQMTPEQYNHAMAQQAAHAAQRLRAQNSVNGAQTDGAGDEMEESVSVIKRMNANGEEIMGRIEIDGLIRDKIASMGQSMEGGGLMLPLHQATNPSKRQRKVKKTASGPAQHDGPGSDDEDNKDLLVKDEDLDEDAINSDLDDPDDALNGDEDDDEGMGHIMLCMYDKVQRVKNKWKCVMKDGVLTVNGKEYVFHKASGEYEW